MRPSNRLVMALLLSLVAAAVFDSDEAVADEATRIHGRVSDVLGNPIAGATVYVVAKTGIEHTLRTDRDGRYQADLAGGGAYTVLASFKNTRAGKQSNLAPGANTALDLELAVSGEGEVIEVEGYPPPAVRPKPTFDVQLAAPYSSEAILTDKWTRAWLLLDVDERGVVRRFKFLKHPGVGLDAIAAKQAFAATFTPARDKSNKPVKTVIVFGIEWPSHGWLVGRTRSAHRIPPLTHRGPRIRPPLKSTPFALLEEVTLDSVPCVGTAPVDFESKYPVLRDCSQPELEKAASAAWIQRP